jgi:N-acetylmuramoyl-L-alanine amidase
MNSLKLASVLCLAALCALVLPVSSPILAQTQGDLVGSGKTIYIDPGHGGQETGAVHVGQDGKVDLIERDVNLSIGLKLRALLEKDGFKVAMSRTTAASPNDPPIDRNDDGRVNNRDQYQAVDDLANESGADLMVSIHNNGSPNEEASGTEVWFSPLRPFADKNLLIASLLQANLVSSIRNAGYDTLDRGIKDDSNYRVYRGRVFEIFVLGQADESTHHPRAAKMPAALGESLFLTNEADAAMLAQDRIQDAIAQGYHDAIVQYFARLAEGTPLEWPVPAIGASYAPPAAEPTPTPTPTPEPGWRRPRPVQMF